MMKPAFAAGAVLIRVLFIRNCLRTSLRSALFAASMTVLLSGPAVLALFLVPARLPARPGLRHGGTIAMGQTIDRRFKAAFDCFDKNGDGHISLAELDQALMARGSLLLEDELEDVMARFGDAGGISFEAFCTLAEERPGASSYADEMIRRAIGEGFASTSSAQHEAAAQDDASHGAGAADMNAFAGFFSLFQEASSAFDAFDEDGDGTICAREIASTVRALGHEPPSEEELTTMIEAYDVNGNGALDFDEFCQLITERVRPPGVDASIVSAISDAARNAVSRWAKGRGHTQGKQQQIDVATAGSADGASSADPVLC